MEKIFWILLAWITISVVTFGGFAVIAYVMRVLKKQAYPDLVHGQTSRSHMLEEVDKHVEAISNEEREQQYKRMIEQFNQRHCFVTIRCLSCGDNIAPDEEPYCTRCFERLEREGFFEE